MSYGALGALSIYRDRIFNQIRTVIDDFKYGKLLIHNKPLSLLDDLLLRDSLKIKPEWVYHTHAKKIAEYKDKSLLIVDDDNPFRDRLARAMEKKGFAVTQAESVKKGIESVKLTKPAFAVIDLRLADGNGLEVVKEIQNLDINSRIIMLTGYGNISTAVAAIKQGAIDYLAKPADADDVEKALLANPQEKAQPPENPMSADRVKWEHIHRVFELCNRNVSETARRLKMHRRTLQRILSKRSPK